LDKWNERCTFIFGKNALPNLVKIAKELDESDRSPLERQPKYPVKTRTRRKPKNIKQEAVQKRASKKNTDHILFALISGLAWSAPGPRV
jgi:hypothetical protein